MDGLNALNKKFAQTVIDLRLLEIGNPEDNFKTSLFIPCVSKVLQPSDSCKWLIDFKNGKGNLRPPETNYVVSISKEHDSLIKSIVDEIRAHGQSLILSEHLHLGEDFHNQKMKFYITARIITEHVGSPSIYKTAHSIALVPDKETDIEKLNA